MHNFKRKALVTLSVVGLTASVAGVAVAATGTARADRQEITVCAATSGTGWRLVSNSTNKCRSGEMLVSWNAQGRKGDTGARGLPGENGAPGLDGENGAPGQDGENGAPGQDGLNGENGGQGEQGLPGDKGDKGDQGEQGLKGDKGDAGEQGPKGDKGDKGDTGEAGVNGSSFYLSESAQTQGSMEAQDLSVSCDAGDLALVPQYDLGEQMDAPHADDVSRSLQDPSDSARWLFTIQKSFFSNTTSTVAVRCLDLGEPHVVG